MSSSYHLTEHPLSVPRRAWPFLCQEKFWINANLERIRIKDMDLEYVVATMNWLVKRAEEVKFMLELYYRQNPEHAQLVADMADVDASKWIKVTPLFQKLLQRFDKLSTQYRKPVAVAKPKIYDTDDELDYTDRQIGGTYG